MSTGNKRSLAVLTALALAAGGAVTLAGGASAAEGGELVYGLTTDDRLVAFRSQTPGTIIFNRDITFSGLTQLNEPNLLGIDVRPATGELYALGENEQLYVIDPATGAATVRGAAITPALQGTLFGFDFNPVADRIRIVSDANQNLRINPDDGGASAGTPAGATTDGSLRYLDTDPNAGVDPAVAAAAYTQSVAGTTTTQQFDIDVNLNTFVLQNSNPGTLQTIGNLGAGDVTNAGLDVSAGTDTTFAALATTTGTGATASTAYGFYTINRTTGAATRVGAFGPAATATSPALQVEDVTVATSRFLVISRSITEGETQNVTIERRGDTADSQSVTYTLTSGSTGSVPADASPSTGTITFAPGETSRTFAVSTLNDDFTEGAETLTVDLSAPTGGAVASDGTVTITDNEAGQAFGLTDGNGLTTFSVNTPGTTTPVVPIRVADGVRVLGIDVRPRTGDLYGVGSDNSVFVINPSTGAISNRQVLGVALDGTTFGVDFNPVADRLRIVSNTDQNLRVNVDNPANVAGGTQGTIVDGVLRYDTADPNATVNPAVAAAAYTNSFNSGTSGTATPTATTQFDIDTQTASLVRQDSNPGTLFTRGPLGLATGVTFNNPGQVGLDAAAAGNALFAVFSTSSTAASLYRVDVTSGRATSLGLLDQADGVSGMNQTIVDIALRSTERATFTAPGSSPSPSPSATATATSSPTVTNTPTTGLQAIVLDVEKDTIVPTEQGVITARGTANRNIELLAYSRPSTEYRVVRTVQLGEDGTAVFRILPGTNTRLYARYTGVANSDSRSVVQNVATALSLTVVRNGSLDYTFQGRILPRRAGQLITLYRVERDGREIITSQIRTDNSGTYRIRRVFTGQGTFGFLTRTGQNLTNVAGVSNGGKARPTAIYAGPQR